MKAFIAATGLVAGASAAVVARDHMQCCFQLTASGGASGTVGQLSDGQNRIGGGYSPATYCISNGAITDASGRGCILTPPTTQFQCDTGATPTGGFSINNNGEVEYNGDNTFYACPASNGVYNIYTTPVDNQPKCTKITLSSGGKCIPAKPTMKTTASPMTSCPAPSTVTVTETEKGKQMYTTVTEHQTCPAPSTVTETEKGKPMYTTVTEHPTCPAPSTVTETEKGKPMYTTVTEHQTCPAPSTVTMSECPTSQMAPPPAPTTTEVQTTYEYTTLAPPTTKPYESQPSSMSPPKESSAPPPTKPSGSACPTELTGAYQTPHLIVPVSSEKPDYAYGTQYNATVTSHECTIFNFDIPYSYSGKSCSTIFLFPEQSQLQTSSYDISGHGDLVFSSLSSAANQQTTWNNCPSKKMELGSCSPAPGNSYSIGTSECAAGTTQSIEVCGTGDLSLSFFEDYNPSPIGVYMTSC